MVKMIGPGLGLGYPAAMTKQAFSTGGFRHASLAGWLAMLGAVLALQSCGGGSGGSGDGGSDNPLPPAAALTPTIGRVSACCTQLPLVTQAP